MLEPRGMHFRSNWMSSARSKAKEAMGNKRRGPGQADVRPACRINSYSASGMFSSNGVS